MRLLEDGVIPAGHGEFDLVWCSEVLEHIPDVAEALYEVRRVLQARRAAAADGPDTRGPRARLRFDATSTRWASTCASSPAARSPRTLEATGFAPVRVSRAGEMLVARATRP